jgi:hypothetical protein
MPDSLQELEANVFANRVDAGKRAMQRQAALFQASQ